MAVRQVTALANECADAGTPDFGEEALQLSLAQQIRNRPPLGSRPERCYHGGRPVVAGRVPSHRDPGMPAHLRAHVAADAHHEPRVRIDGTEKSVCQEAALQTVAAARPSCEPTRPPREGDNLIFALAIARRCGSMAPH